jgi:tRNA A37 threonylcarbamoyladenosine biosynthesis protein TsaE
VIEWPDFFFEVLPPERVLVRFALSSPEERVLEFEPSGVKPRAIVERLAECWRERETEEKR